MPIDDAPARRLVTILETLAGATASERQGLSVSELARRVGKDKSSISRQLRQLTEVGLVERSSDGSHRLGWLLFTLAAQAGDNQLQTQAPPVMRQVARLAGERVHLSVRHQDDVLTVMTEGPQRAIEAVGWVGRTVPIMTTSSGRALILDDAPNEIDDIFALQSGLPSGPKAATNPDELRARVERARTQGYAVAIDEFEEGLSSVAAPIRDQRGQIVAAINVSAPTYRFTRNQGETTRLVKQAAQQLTKVLAAPGLSARSNV